MDLRPSAVPTAGYVLGTLLGLAPLLYLSGPGFSTGVAVFLGTILVAPIAVVWLAVEAWRAVRGRRRSAGDSVQ